MQNNYIPIRLIIADDHEIFRDGFQVMIRKTKKVDIIGEASNGKELVELAHELLPDIIVTDIKMPVMNGIDATHKLKRELPDIGIIALSMFDEDDLIVEMLEAGAQGYLLKNAHKDEILAAIQAVYFKQNYYCSNTTAHLSRMIALSKFDPFGIKDKPEFSEKELHIIKLICKQYSSKQIADELSLSRRTIEGYREQVLRKIKAKNTAGIVIYAIKNRLFEVDELAI